MHRVANFYSDADSNQLCRCLESVAHLDTADGATTTLQAHELVVVLRNTLHRLRVEGRAGVLVIDSIKG